MDANLMTEMKGLIEEIKVAHKQHGTDISSMASEMKKLAELTAKLQEESRENQKRLLVQQLNGMERHVPGRLSRRAAEALGAEFLMHANLTGKGKLSEMIKSAECRTRLISAAEQVQKALSTTEVPLPDVYAGELRELIAEYGVARRVMTPWTIGNGTSKLPRSKTGFAFTFLGAGAQFSEKTPAIEFSSLESHKCGGIIYLPREIDEQSLVDLGQLLAMMAAPRFALIEDQAAFLGDGSATYDTITGINAMASTVGKKVTMANTKTSPNDVTAANFQAVLAKVNSSARMRGAWYLNNTWEAKLPDLNTQANQYVFRYRPDGTPLLYGKPIIWTEVLQEHTADAAAGKVIAGFGDLSWFWFATRPGGARIDRSDDFKFDYDLASIRMLEEMDVDYMSNEAYATLQTAAN